MKKKLIFIIIFVLLVETIIPNFIYAIDIDDLEINSINFEEVQQAYTEESWNRLKNEGKAQINLENGRRTKQLTETLSLGATAASVVGTVILIPAVIVSSCLTIMTREPEELLIKGDTVTAWDESMSSVLGKVGGTSVNFFTIEDTVFGKIDLFDADYFLVDQGNNKINKAIKESVAMFYYILRTISLVIGVLTLVYVGIRMALSTVASEMAKYKDMLKDWLVSMIMIFLMPYIIGFINLIANSMTNVFAMVSSTRGFEKSIIWQSLNILNISTGWTYVAVILMYIVITFYQVKFFLMYFYRLLAMGFLIVISPLITILYSTTKTKISGKGGRSLVFDSWLREYSINAFLQPLHAAIYLFFIASANEIFKVAPLLAVIFFGMLSKAESIVKNIMGMTKTRSINGMSEYMPIKKLGNFVKREKIK